MTPGRSGRRPWLLPVLIVGGILVLVAAGAGVLVLLYFFGSTEVEVSAADRALMLDITAVAEWMEDYSPELDHEVVVKVRYLDRSYEIDYTYDVPDDEHAPYLNYTVSEDVSSKDALASYLMLWSATKIGFLIIGDVKITVDQRDEIFRWGDRSRFGLVQADGAPLGNLFVAQKGRYVVYLLLTGVYFDETGPITELLSPYLAKLEE